MVLTKHLLFQQDHGHGKNKFNRRRGRSSGHLPAGATIAPMPEYRFQNAAVIGTGMMGPGIALTLALGGVSAAILSRTAEGAARGVGKAHAQLEFLTANGLVGAAAAAAAASLISGRADFDEAIRAADLVIESGPERMEWKQDLFASVDQIAPQHAILATNTSGLSITAIAQGCARPERVLTTHFWNPPHLMPLVEIVKGEKTSAEAALAVRDLLLHCGKTPVIVNKDRPGQLGNRLQIALVREAANIVAEGIADAEAVDTVAKNGFGLRMPAYGILEHQDLVGLDMGLSIVDYVVRDLYNEPHAPDYFRDLTRAGHLGVKSGRGFYDWSVKSADAVKTGRDRFLVEVLRYRKSV
jgi:3-hydroxybutyryl-CoA dehydrogenase